MDDAVLDPGDLPPERSVGPAAHPAADPPATPSATPSADTRGLPADPEATPPTGTGGLPAGHRPGREREVLVAVCAAAGSLLGQLPTPVARLRIRCGEVSIDLRWPAWPGSEPAGPAAGADRSSAPVSPSAAVLDEAAAAAAADLRYVRAPMVGTFYRAPAPDAPPFVQVGDVVEAGQQVGVLEAMKLMNPVEAESPGRVVEILVPDATGVEFDQRLIALAPPERGD